MGVAILSIRWEVHVTKTPHGVRNRCIATDARQDLCPYCILPARAIYAACEYFVNGIEWCGRRLNLEATAIGSVLAAFGTARPESAVTFMAVVFGKIESWCWRHYGWSLSSGELAYAVVDITHY